MLYLPMLSISVEEALELIMEELVGATGAILDGLLAGVQLDGALRIIFTSQLLVSLKSLLIRCHPPLYTMELLSAFL